MIPLTILLGGVTHFRAIVSHLCMLQSWSGVQHIVFPIKTGPSTVSWLGKRKWASDLASRFYALHPFQFIFQPLLNDLQWPCLLVTLFLRELSPKRAHLSGQRPGIERRNVQLLLLLSWIKKYIYSPRSHTGELLHNGI